MFSTQISPNPKPLDLSKSFTQVLSLSPPLMFSSSLSSNTTWDIININWLLYQQSALPIQLSSLPLHHSQILSSFCQSSLIIIWSFSITACIPFTILVTWGRGPVPDKHRFSYFSNFEYWLNDVQLFNCYSLDQIGS